MKNRNFIILLVYSTTTFFAYGMDNEKIDDVSSFLWSTIQDGELEEPQDQYNVPSVPLGGVSNDFGRVFSIITQTDAFVEENEGLFDRINVLYNTKVYCDIKVKNAKECVTKYGFSNLQEPISTMEGNAYYCSVKLNAIIDKLNKREKNFTESFYLLEWLHLREYKYKIEEAAINAILFAENHVKRLKVLQFLRENGYQEIANSINLSRFR